MHSTLFVLPYWLLAKLHMRDAKKFFEKKIFFLQPPCFHAVNWQWPKPWCQQKKNHIFSSNGSKVIQFFVKIFFGSTLYMATKVRNACNFGTICQNLSCNSLNERSWQAPYVGTPNVDLSTNMWTRVRKDILDFVQKNVSGCYWSVNLWACAKWDQSTVMWAEVRKKIFSANYCVVEPNTFRCCRPEVYHSSSAPNWHIDTGPSAFCRS